LAKVEGNKGTSRLGGGKPVPHSHVEPYSEDVKRMQRKMQAAGIDPGPIDGLKGPLTRAGMRQYEARFGSSAAEGLDVDPGWAELPRDRRDGAARSPSNLELPGAKPRQGANAPTEGPGPLTNGALAYPLPVRGQINGRPYQGTHNRGNWQSDNAIDLSIPVGTPIYAVTDGVIGPRIGALDSSDPRLQGLRLTLEGGDNSFFYAHLSDLTVRAGERVKKGQLLGYSGSANGVPHLHLGVERGRADKLFGW
jgi:murein DD-endopeptidase MepM/ murein hydrolase activator NlpD